MSPPEILPALDIFGIWVCVEYYASTPEDDFGWLFGADPDEIETLKQFDKWAREPDVFFRITSPEDDLVRGGSYDAMDQSVAHIITQTRT